jgi:hypothetical protein
MTRHGRERSTGALWSKACGSCMVQGCLAEISRITALLGERDSLSRAARPPEPTLHLAVRHQLLHAATKESLP